MLGIYPPMLVYYINNPNDGKQTSNIGSLYLLSQCWETIHRCWYTILIIPMMGNRHPILVVCILLSQRWDLFFHSGDTTLNYQCLETPPTLECCFKI